MRSLIDDPIPIPALWDTRPIVLGQLSHKAGIDLF